MNLGSLQALHVAAAVGVTAKTISDWVNKGVLHPEKRSSCGRGRPRHFGERQVIQARVVKRAACLGLTLKVIAPILDLIPQVPVPGSCLCIRFSEQQDNVDAVVMQWSDVDPSDGDALIVIHLR